MSSIIINSFYRALTSIDEYEGIKNLTVKQLTTLLVDQLYPEDGVLTWENEKTLKIKFNGKVPVEEETHSVEITIPVAEPVVAEKAPEPEVKEIKVKEVKPKLTKEQKAAEKAEKEAKAAEAKAAKELKAAEAKAAKETKAAKPKAPKAKESAEPVIAKPVVAEPPAPAEPVVAEPKATKPKAVKAKFVGNLEKLNPTQDKLWKKVAAELLFIFQIIKQSHKTYGNCKPLYKQHGYVNAAYKYSPYKCVFIKYIASLAFNAVAHGQIHNRKPK